MYRHPQAAHLRAPLLEVPSSTAPVSLLSVTCRPDFAPRPYSPFRPYARKKTAPEGAVNDRQERRPAGIAWWAARSAQPFEIMCRAMAASKWAGFYRNASIRCGCCKPMRAQRLRHGPFRSCRHTRRPAHSGHAISRPLSSSAHFGS